MNSWLIPCSPKIYDAEGAFNEYGEIIWHQQCNMNIGDTAYIYVTAPVKEIKCKCSVEDVDIPVDVGTDEGYTLDENFCNRAYSRYMRLKLIKAFDCEALGYQFLRMNGLNSSIRSQRRAGEDLVRYLFRVAE